MLDTIVFNYTNYMYHTIGFIVACILVLLLFIFSNSAMFTLRKYFEIDKFTTLIFLIGIIIFIFCISLYLWPVILGFILYRIYTE